jgi:hypothetical protein
LSEDIIQEQDVPIEEDDILSDDADFDEAVEEETIIDWDKDEFETDTETD